MRHDQPSYPVYRAIAAACLLAAASGLIGCDASPRSATAPAGTERNASASMTDTQRWTAAERSRQLLLGSEVGLEVREWIIEADSYAIAQAVAAYRADVAAYRADADEQDMAGRFVDPDLTEQLRINGLRLIPVRVDDLPMLEAALGFATLNRRGWYGQLAEWMSLHGQRAGGPHQAVFIDGRAQRFDRGEYRLMARAWVLPMEDGPKLNLQLVPEYQPPQRDSLHHLLARPTHDGTRRGQPISSITADLLLDPDYALILTGEEPTVDWREPNANGSSPDRNEEARNEPANNSDGDPDASDDEPDRERDHLGPYVELPQTLGELLFTLGGVRGGRGMLIFVARVPPEMKARSE